MEVWENKRIPTFSQGSCASHPSGRQCPTSARPVPAQCPYSARCENTQCPWIPRPQEGESLGLSTIQNSEGAGTVCFHNGHCTGTVRALVGHCTGTVKNQLSEAVERRPSSARTTTPWARLPSSTRRRSRRAPPTHLQLGFACGFCASPRWPGHVSAQGPLFGNVHFVRRTIRQSQRHVQNCTAMANGRYRTRGKRGRKLKRKYIEANAVIISIFVTPVKGSQTPTTSSAEGHTGMPDSVFAA